MANYNRGSRYRTASTGMFRGKNVLYPEFIDFSQVEIINSYTIPVEAEYRPDLISLNVFRRDDLWWIIMATNNFDSVNQLYAGRIIKVPNINGLI
jgi:hypothetical protein